MKGSKKLQDWFSDRHWSIPEKDSAILAIRKDGRIAAILGETIDNTVRVTPRTKNIIRITFI
jgi:tRNA(Ile)-lysidine synthase